LNRQPFEDAYMNLMSSDKYSHLSFYSFVIAKMKIDITTKVPTAGAGFYNNTYNLLVNPEFFSTLSMDERVAVLIHECQHVILQHIFRKGARDHKLFNIAADIAINQFIDNIPEGGMFPKTFDFDEHLSTEQYYTLLKKEQQKQQKEKDEHEDENGLPDDCESCSGKGEQESDEDCDSCGGSGETEKDGKKEECQDCKGSGKGKEKCEDCDGSGEQPGTGWPGPKDGKPDLTSNKELTLDSHEAWEKVNPEDEELAKDQMGRILEDAISKSRGNTPSNIEQLMELWRKKPVISWKRVLKRYVASKKGSKISTIKRRDRRLPNRHDLKGKKTFYDQPTVVVGIDVSGSMSDDEIFKGLVEVQEVCKITHSKLKVVQIDTDIQGMDEFNEKTKNFTRRGCGGTYMGEMPKYLNENKIPHDVLILITDGYIENVSTDTNWLNHRKPVLFLTTTGEMTDVCRNHKVMDISQA
ncbi:MAG: hypothetical protein J7L15_09500, partial [Clostridiales bacterium]|nr:hypothetical protein [Clostridiales bacterium]